MASKPQIAIIGGGIAGLTFSLSLDPKKYDCHIFEKNESFGEVGAAISVFPNALDVMDHVGLLEQILESAGRIDKMFLKTKSGKVLSTTTPKEEYPLICIHRAELHQILLKNSPAKLHTGHAFQSFNNAKNGQVDVQFENGVEKTFDAVIGADGIHSAVRQQIIDDGPPVFRGYNIWRGVVSTAIDMNYASETYGHGQRVGIVPISKDRFGWWATANEKFMEDDEPEGAKAKLRRLFGDWHEPVPTLMHETESILKNSLSDRPITSGWTEGNVTLLGDAAHPTTPNLGQGGCMAMEGAYILAQCLHEYGLSQDAYQRYEELQFPRAKKIVNESLRIGKIGQWENPIATSLRNWAFQLTPSKVAMRLIDQYFSYRVTQLSI